MARGQFRRAVDLTDVPLDTIPLKALAAEYATTYALASAVAGEYEAAEASLRREGADFLDGQVDALRRLAVITVELGKGTLKSADLDEHLACLNRVGCFDAFVFTYRAVPELLRRATTHARWRPLLERIVTSANDVALGNAAGLLEGTQSALSPRELEVLNFVVQGLRNREIGKRLFISEVTVKAHLRRIYAKLGVKSRTEAVLAAADLPGTGFQNDNGAR
jgi:ATP/maltotriose-dependent transcriptional regulator MalT